MYNCPVTMVALLIGTHQGPCSGPFGDFGRGSLGGGRLKRERKREQSLRFLNFNLKGKSNDGIRILREASLSDEVIKDGDN